MANSVLTPEIASKLMACMQAELVERTLDTTVFRQMAPRDRDRLDPREEAYRIVSDLMRDSSRYGPGIEPSMIMNVLEKIIDERNYWQRECEGARRYMDMAPLAAPGRGGSGAISAVAIKKQYYDTALDQIVEYWDGKTKVVEPPKKAAPKKEPETPKEPEPPADPVRARMQGLDFGDEKK